MLLSLREPLHLLGHSSRSRTTPSRSGHRPCLASLSVEPRPGWNNKRCTRHVDGSAFDPSGVNAAWEAISGFFSQTLESTSSTRKDKSSNRGLAAAIEDSSIDIGDFFRGPLPGKFLKLLGYLALSRVGIYVPLGGVNREAFLGNFDQNSLLSTLDSFSGGGIGRLGICSLGIVPFINASIVFQLLTQIYPKLQDLQKREGEAGRKKILQYTRYASVGFAVVQAIGQVFFLRPYVNDFSTEWVLSSVTLLTLGISIHYLHWRKDNRPETGKWNVSIDIHKHHIILACIIWKNSCRGISGRELHWTCYNCFILFSAGSWYRICPGMQEAERKIPLNYASRYNSRGGGLQKSAYLPFKVNSSGVMPIIFQHLH
ncbi:preprotein translocase subunit SCY1, chloroplastic isoform X1 [Iris pallida]|uniref:Preprotein translocase subunit SCY1, chloroplastic isoform X1 n=1 Tax=Iris pallida TaxID=29817 RepID=A0AAX6HYS8_IRIPA|nr:preprotein translocase subunit SCY1, chloroplastic isoform X1 [Iris pallida]